MKIVTEVDWGKRAAESLAKLSPVISCAVNTPGGSRNITVSSQGSAFRTEAAERTGAGAGAGAIQ